MKKFVAPIILAAVLGICGGVTVVLSNRVNTVRADDIEDTLPMVEVKNGNYYLNGDTKSDLWIEVNSKFLILKGTDVDKSIRDAIVKQQENEDLTSCTNEEIEAARQWMFDEDKILYCTEKIYTVQPVGLKNMPYILNVSRHNDESTSDELRRSNAAFPYNHDTNTINLSLFGDFILVE